jgi:GTP pyrophosphokinase
MLGAEVVMSLSHRFEDALVYAARLHATQVRKGTSTPYVAHLLGVAAIALEHGAGEDQAIAALLHDAVEDQGGAPTREEIRWRFGDAVTAIVDACTDADTVPKPPWRARKEAYIAHLAHVSSDARLVSEADKLYNARAILNDLRTVGEAVWQRFAGKRDGTLWYYRSLVTAFRACAPATPGEASLVDELDRVVTEIERLA